MDAPIKTRTAMKETVTPGDHEFTDVSLVIDLGSIGAPFQSIPSTVSSHLTSVDCAHQSKWSLSISH